MERGDEFAFKRKNETKMDRLAASPFCQPFSNRHRCLPSRYVQNVDGEGSPTVNARKRIRHKRCGLQLDERPHIVTSQRPSY